MTNIHTGGKTNAGTAYVIYGNGDELNNIDVTSLASAQGFRILGAAAGDYASSSVSYAGDINGDKIDDIIVSAEYATLNGRNAAGGAYVIYGNSTGSTDIDLLTLTATQSFRITFDIGDTVAGMVVSGAGDVNSDGLSDVIVGNAAGKAYVIYGNSGGLADIDLANFTSTQGFKIIGVNEAVGYAVGRAGDVNGDGISDVIVGAPSAYPSGRVGAGGACVSYGKSNGLTDINVENFTPAQGFKILGGGAGDSAGIAASSAGDVNGDGLSDVIISALYSDSNSRADAGAAYVIYGRKTINGTIGNDIIFPSLK